MPRLQIPQLRNATISAVIFVVIESLVGLALFTGFIPQTTSGFVVAGVITLFVVLYVGLFLFVSLRVGRFYQQAARGDDRGAPMVPAQPDPALALAPGATLHLERGVTASGAVRGIARYTYIILFFTALIVLFEGIFLPVLPWNALVGNTFPVVLTSSEQWLIVAVMPTLAAIGILSLILSYNQEAHVVITADDQGIAVRHGWRSAKSIPWNDIRLFIRSSVLSSDQALSAFLLIGEHHSVAMPLQPPLALLDGGSTILSLSPRFVRFVGGVDAYRQDAERLLATIAARSHIPLRAARFGYFARRMNAAFGPLAGLTYQDVQRLPELSTEQMHILGLDTAERASNAMGRARFRNVATITSSIGLAFFAIGFIVISSTLFNLGGHPPPRLVHSIIVTMLTDLFLIVVEVPLLALVYSRAYNPIVRATTDGLRVRRVIIPWGDIRALGVQLPQGKGRLATYGAFWGGRTATWPGTAAGSGHSAQAEPGRASGRADTPASPCHSPASARVTAAFSRGPHRPCNAAPGPLVSIREAPEYGDCADGAL